MLLVVGGVVAAAALAFGIRLWLPARFDPDQRAGLGTGLIGGVLIAVAFLFVQIFIDHRRQHDEAEASLRLQLGVDDSLDGIDLSNKHLVRVYLAGKSMARAQMIHAHLDRANLSEATLTDSNLSEARLRCANLDQAHLDGATFQDAKLDDASLVGASGHGTAFFHSDLRGADLSQADFRDASFIESDLSGADLTEANLSAADLSETNLDGVYSDATTKWPKDPDKRPKVIPKPRNRPAGPGRC